MKNREPQILELLKFFIKCAQADVFLSAIFSLESNLDFNFQNLQFDLSDSYQYLLINNTICNFNDIVQKTNILFSLSYTEYDYNYIIENLPLLIIIPCINRDVIEFVYSEGRKYFELIRIY